MTEQIERKTIDDLTPDPNNVNKHTLRGHGIVENSIRRRGVGRGILAAGKGVDKPVIMAGNLTHEKARDAGIEELIFVHTTGNQLVVTVRDDLDPNSPEAIALGIEDNEASKLSYNPDTELLAALTAGDDALLINVMAEDRIFEGMIEEARNRDAKGFKPNLAPQFSTAKVLDADVVKEKAELDNRFKENSEYIEVICPHCSQEFYVNKKDVK